MHDTDKNVMNGIRNNFKASSMHVGEKIDRLRRRRVRRVTGIVDGGVKTNIDK